MSVIVEKDKSIPFGSRPTVTVNLCRESSEIRVAIDSSQDEESSALLLLPRLCVNERQLGCFEIAELGTRAGH